MKRKIYYASLIWGLLLTQTSCDSILNQTPANYVSDSGIIVDEASAKAALNGVYHRLAANEYYGGGIFNAAIYLSGDNVTWTGSLNYYYDYNTHQYGADNQLLASAWNAIYLITFGIL